MRFFQAGTTSRTARTIQPVAPPTGDQGVEADRIRLLPSVRYVTRREKVRDGGSFAAARSVNIVVSRRNGSR